MCFFLPCFGRLTQNPQGHNVPQYMDQKRKVAQNVEKTKKFCPHL
uniref:Uncharacterized protein n=1 Tax=Octopus bimaculoides TaxID=37653 RepID=A0A0L8ICR6_OCTBM